MNPTRRLSSIIEHTNVLIWERTVVGLRLISRLQYEIFYDFGCSTKRVGVSLGPSNHFTCVTSTTERRPLPEQRKPTCHERPLIGWSVGDVYHLLDEVTSAINRTTIAT